MSATPPPIQYIFKFSGMCFESGQTVRQALNIINTYKAQHSEPIKIICVCAAKAGTTNKLIDFMQSTYAGGQTGSQTRELLTELHNEHMDLAQEFFEEDSPMLKEVEEFFTKSIKEFKTFEEPIRQNGMVPELSDQVLAQGEKIMAFLFTKCLQAAGHAVAMLDETDFIITNNDFGHALPLLAESEPRIIKRVRDGCNEADILVVSGFVGTTKSGRTTTLGRGGSDFSATIIAHALYVEQPESPSRLILWKGTDYVMSANPDYQDNPKVLNKISYWEARELVFYGRQNIHPLCINTAERRNIRIEIRDFFEPESEKYTIICPREEAIGENQTPVSALMCISDLALISLNSDIYISFPGILNSILNMVSEHNSQVYFVSQSPSENNITIGVKKKEARKVVRTIQHSEYHRADYTTIEIKENCSLITAVGAGMVEKPEISAEIIKCLYSGGIPIFGVAQGIAKNIFTAVIDRDHLGAAIRRLYAHFVA